MAEGQMPFAHGHLAGIQARAALVAAESYA
jgi:hypothetical protein